MTTRPTRQLETFPNPNPERDYEISFDAPEMGGREVVIDGAYVRERLEAILQDQDLSRYIL